MDTAPDLSSSEAALPERADGIASCQAVPSRGSRTTTGVSVDRRPAYTTKRTLVLANVLTGQLVIGATDRRGSVGDALATPGVTQRDVLRLTRPPRGPVHRRD
jgi:hypothetical protein